jgi:uncharacterized membrane protein YidH (DUF202 family)
MSSTPSALDPEHPPRDPGLASERTALAWNRSGLAVLVVVAVLVRRLWPLQGGTSVVILTVAGAGGLVWAAGLVLTRGGLHQESSGVLTVAGGRALTAGTLLLALAGFLLGLLSVP